MKILLLGDYSSLYNNLQDGLRELGHEAVLASSGDSWKNIPRDIDLGGGGTSLASKIARKIAPIVNFKKLSGYDIVQYINPFYFYHRMMPNEWIIERIMKNNGKFFLSAAGSDAYFWRFARKNMRYGPFDGFLRYDTKEKKHYLLDERSFVFNKWMASKVDGIIPIMHEYSTLAYGSHPNLKSIIPAPINIKKIAYKKNCPDGKIVFFHGLNRYGFKGTNYIENAFEQLADKYKNEAEFIIKGGMPLNEYAKLMEKVNVVIDQTSSYSLGMNGLYAMAMGKMVMGGAEPESLEPYSVEFSPVVNILPCPQDIIEKVDMVMEKKKEMEEIGYCSRKFIEQHHDYIKIADSYLRTWNEVKN